LKGGESLAEREEERIAMPRGRGGWRSVAG